MLRRAVRLGAVVTLIATVGGASGASLAVSADPCTGAGGVPGTTGNPGELTCTFATPNSAATPSYSFTVPSGVPTVTITAAGGKGGDTSATVLGGSGAVVKGSFSGLAGESLTIVVGAQGASGLQGGAGGYPNGGHSSSPAAAGGGGGGSSVTHAGTPLVVAGAGGGAGGYGVPDQTVITPPVKGGVGGGSGGGGGGGASTRYAGTFFGTALGGSGGLAPADASGIDGVGGNGGRGVDGGQGPCSGGSGGAGSSGSAGHGGNGGVQGKPGGGGGGGGGGYGGGGGGGAAGHCDSRGTLIGGGGGGGGGSSHYDAAATSPSVTQGANAGDGSVVLTYAPSGPTVSVYSAPGVLQHAPFSVSFDRPVKGVSTSTFTVVEVGLGSGLAGKISCLDASNASVNCGAGPVSTARFTPKKALWAGEYYFVNMNPTSSGVVGYSDGVPVAPWQGYVRAQTAFSSDQYPLQYAWGKVVNAAAVGGSYLQDQFADAGESFPFTGTSLDLIMWGGPDRGTAKVTITSAGQADVTQTIDTYAASAGDQTFSFNGLPAGKHTASITLTGQKNAASSGTYIGFDAVRVNGAPFTPKLSATWSDGPGFGYRFTRQKGATLTLFYRGTGVTLNALMGPNNGQAKVTIDGVLVGTIDLYSPSYSYQDIPLTYTGIDDTAHLLKLTVLGKKTALSSDKVVTINSLTLN